MFAVTCIDWAEQDYEVDVKETLAEAHSWIYNVWIGRNQCGSEGHWLAEDMVCGDTWEAMYKEIEV